jgi:hypothetical protein
MLARRFHAIAVEKAPRAASAEQLSRAVLHPEGRINANVMQMQYAVRGAVVSRAGELKAQLAKGTKLPFKDIIYCNIGNPQVLKQKPLTFLSQLSALCVYPPLVDAPPPGFKADVVQRARDILAATPGGTGAYSDSRTCVASVARRCYLSFSLSLFFRVWSKRQQLTSDCATLSLFATPQEALPSFVSTWPSSSSAAT